MERHLEALVDFCKRYKYVVCYGAAQYGYTVKNFLARHNIQVNFFLISENVKADAVQYGIPVFSVKDEKVSLEDCGIILSLSSMYYPTVKENLINRQVELHSVYELTAENIADMDSFVTVDEGTKVLRLGGATVPNEKIAAYEAKIRDICSKYERVEVKFMTVNVIGNMQYWIAYYYRRTERKERVFELYYPVELFRTYNGKDTAVANEYLLGKLACDHMEAVSRGNLDFWQYFIKKQASFFVFEKEYKEITRLFNVPEILSKFNWKKKYISFNPDEEIQAKEKMMEIGLASDYVCMANRDESYYKKRGIKQKGQGDIFRNSQFSTRKKAIAYLKQKKIQSVRMGVAVDESFSCEGLIDYASKYRTEFMDVHLAAKCKFFVSDFSGLVALPALFSKPQIITNVPHLTMRFEGIPFISPQRDIALLKKMWDTKNKRFLNLREILAWESDSRYSDKITENTYQLYYENGIVPIENSEQEILEAVKEMNDRVDGLYKENENDQKLQQRYREIIDCAPLKNYAIALPLRLSAFFLQENQWLLE